MANSISPDRVAFVDVLKGLSKTTLYGASGGVLAIYTKSPDEMKGRYRYTNGMLNLTHPGYYKSKQFYSPDHRDTTQDRADYGTSLHWQPNLVFRRHQKTIEIPFSSCDRTSVYQVIFQGITTDGKPLTQTVNFSVE